MRKPYPYWRRYETVCPRRRLMQRLEADRSSSLTAVSESSEVAQADTLID